MITPTPPFWYCAFWSVLCVALTGGIYLAVRYGVLWALLKAGR